MAVRTAILLERELYRQMDRMARRMGVPRSRLFARAVEEFIDRQDGGQAVSQINKAYSRPESKGDAKVRRLVKTKFRKLVEGTW